MRFSDVAMLEHPLFAGDIEPHIDRIGAMALDGLGPVGSRLMERFGGARGDQRRSLIEMFYVNKIPAFGRKHGRVFDSSEPVARS